MVGGNSELPSYKGKTVRYRKLTKWENPSQCAGLIFFAQLLEEMLFDFSLDTYKASVMNTGTLCLEALQTIREVELGNIKAPNIHHVVAELCSNFERDVVAQELVALPTSAYFPTLKNPKTPIKELQHVLELLSFQLSSSGYRLKNEALLKNEICNGQSIPIIRRLARSYITTLIATGVSQKYLTETTLNFFYHGPNRISGPESIENFFACFRHEPEEFTVIFKVESIFEYMKDALGAFDLTIQKELPSNLNLSAFPSFTSKDAKLYAIVRVKAARDIYSARAGAETRLQLGATLHTLFHHKEHPSWLPECIVVNAKGEPFRVKKSVNSMHKCADLTKPVASTRLQLFMSDFSLEQKSLTKFVRTAQLHSMALASNADENQILNLWIALESLVPSETKSDDTSNIEHIVKSLVPFLNVGYLDRLLNNLVKDLLRWNQSIVRPIFRQIPGKKFTNKLIRLLVITEYSAELQKLKISLLDFHLLRDRIEYFQDLLSNPSSIIAALNAHEVRLAWQIRRIYRTRNLIVHTGQTPAYTPLLIAHTHDYLDTVMASLVGLGSKPKKIHSVEQGFKHIELNYSTYVSRLSQKALIFDQENIDFLMLNG